MGACVKKPMTFNKKKLSSPQEGTLNTFLAYSASQTLTESQQPSIIEFLKEYKSLKNHKEMSLEDFKNILAERFHFFLEGHTKSVTCLAVTSDNKFLVSGSLDNTVRIWDIQKKTQEAALKGHTSYVTCLAITSNNHFIISGSSDSTIRIWSILHKKQEDILQIKSGYVKALAITSDSKYIVSADGRIIRIWSFDERKIVGILEGHESYISSMAITNDNKYIISGTADPRGLYMDYTVRKWSISELRQIEILYSFEGTGVCSIAISRDDTFIVIGCKENTVILWNVGGAIQRSQIETHLYSENTVRIMRDDKYAVTASSEHVNVWDLQDCRQEFVRFRCPNIRCMAITNDDKHIIIGSLFNDLQIMSIHGNMKENFQGHDQNVEKVIFSSDYIYIVSGSHSNTIKIWNVLTKIQEFSICIRYSSFSLTRKNEYLIVGCADTNIRLFHIINQRKIILLKGHAAIVTSVTTTINNKFIISSDGNTMRAWRF